MTEVALSDEIVFIMAYIKAEPLPFSFCLVKSEICHKSELETEVWNTTPFFPPHAHTHTEIKKNKMTQNYWWLKTLKLWLLATSTKHFSNLCGNREIERFSDASRLWKWCVSTVFWPNQWIFSCSHKSRWTYEFNRFYPIF